MRKLTLTLNSLVVVFFAFFIAYTFFAKSHIEDMAREFVTLKTLEYAKPSVEVAEESLKSPLIQKLLSEEQILALRDEISDYRDGPSSYVSKLTGQHPQELEPADPNPIVAKLASLKIGIKKFYDGTLQALIADLRIFSISNLLAGLFAIGLVLFSHRAIRKSIVGFSILMFVSVLYCSLIYLDDLSFFRILFRSHMGWWYAVFLSLVMATLYRDLQWQPVEEA